MGRRYGSVFCPWRKDFPVAGLGLPYRRGMSNHEPPLAGPRECVFPNRCLESELRHNAARSKTTCDRKPSSISLPGAARFPILCPALRARPFCAASARPLRAATSPSSKDTPPYGREDCRETELSWSLERFPANVSRWRGSFGDNRRWCTDKGARSKKLFERRFPLYVR